MTDAGLSESTLEQTTLAWLYFLGWQTALCPDISPDGPAYERDSYDLKSGDSISIH